MRDLQYNTRKLILELAQGRRQRKAEQEARLRDMHARGYATLDIAARLGMRPEAARERLRKLGLPQNPVRE